MLDAACVLASCAMDRAHSVISVGMQHLHHLGSCITTSHSKIQTLNKSLCWWVQAHSALGARLQEEQSNSAQLNGQLQDGQAAAAKLQRTIADLEQQVNSPFPH